MLTWGEGDLWGVGALAAVAAVPRKRVERFGIGFDEPATTKNYPPLQSSSLNTYVEIKIREKSENYVFCKF